MEIEERSQHIFTKGFFALFCINMAVFFVFYALIATLPLYVTGVLHGTEDDAGLLVSIFLISAIIVRPFSGKLLDLYGKKKMLVFSIVIYTFCTVLYLFVQPFWLLLILRFFQGIWFSILTTAAGSLAADTIPVNRKGAGLGYFAMSANLAIVAGPATGLFFIQQFSYDAMFMLLSGMAIVGSLIALMLPMKEQIVKRGDGFAFTWHDLFEKKALPIALLGALVAIAYSSVLSFISLYAQEQGLLNAVSYFLFVFAAALIVSRPFTGKVYDQFGAKFVVIPSFLLFIVGVVVLAFADTTLLFVVAGAFVGIGYGTLSTGFQSQAVQATLQERSGYATATYFTLFDGGIALGSYLFGLMVLVVPYSVIYIVSAVILFVALVVYVTVMNKKKSNTSIL